MHDRDGVHLVLVERRCELIRFERTAEGHRQAHHLLAAPLGDPGEPVAEEAAINHEHTLAHATRHRRLHEPRGGAGGHQHGARGTEESLELRLHPLQHRDHLGAPVREHRVDHGLQHVDVNVGRAGEEEAAEGIVGGHTGRSHHVSRSRGVRNWSSTPPRTISSLVTN